MAPGSLTKASLRGQIGVGHGESVRGDGGEGGIHAKLRQLLVAAHHVHKPTLALAFGLIALGLVAYFRQQRISCTSIWILRSRRRRQYWPSRNRSPSRKGGAAGAACLTASACDTSSDQALDMARQEKKEQQQPGSENRNPLRPRPRTPTPHTGPSATVHLAQGRYTGVLLPASFAVPRAVEAWRGIPFAQTTGGQNRFRPPVPLAVSASSAATPLDASAFGPVCPGTASRIPGMVDGEDCLNLNVYRPAVSSPYGPGGGAASKMPVVVYVHGGAFNGGLGTERDMSSFVGWSSTPIVGVNFNYRVGALGFPSSTTAEREGALNLGLRDQRLLFEWVRQNIGQFGGDEARVTLMGMSAGAHSIGYHLQSYTSEDAPFHRAIMESGGATARATLSSSHPRTEGQFREFLAAAGIEPTHTPADQVFPILRSLPLETILYASSTVFSRYQDPIRWPFQPVVESLPSSGGGNEGRSSNGGVIPDLPINHFRRGSHLRIPVLAGFNTNEGTVFASPRVDTGDEFLGKFAAMIPGLGGADLAALARLYPDPVTDPSGPYASVPPGFGRQWARYEAAYSHYAYICPVLQTGHFHSDHDESGGGGDDYPVWIYHFAALSRPDFGGKANHVDEAALVAHDMAAIGGFPGLVRTSDAMHGAWTRFIATGDPNPAHIDGEAGHYSALSSSASTPFWPRFSSPLVGDTALAPGQLRRKGRSEGEECGRVMMFGLGNDERMGGAGRSTPGVPATVVRMTDGEVEKCRFWWERVELSEGTGRRLGRGAARSNL
ncbi:hypothetical protein INS49_011339 [Diaporthe citri]|uniref:uncharacterized protein n=1 Tax=Diaporthe citri TaxID=83186 RepID=UPI001C7FC52F|nr:uncharacterized protein INS49_011339 [Diaporthe citri]KAG6360282.1 hypothetical protein INS49_011339 [Diaporthe citri]